MDIGGFIRHDFRDPHIEVLTIVPGLYNPGSLWSSSLPTEVRVTSSIAANQTILVVGGGIGGMTAALEAAECGKQAAI